MIKFTDKAIAKMQAIIRDNNVDMSKVGVRVGLMGGGCHGYAYHLDFEPIKENDNVISYEGFDVYCDPCSSMYLAEMEVDYEDMDLMREGFKFNNPNTKSTCSCEKSVSF